MELLFIHVMSLDINIIPLFTSGISILYILRTNGWLHVRITTYASCYASYSINMLVIGFKLVAGAIASNAFPIHTATLVLCCGLFTNEDSLQL